MSDLITPLNCVTNTLDRERLERLNAATISLTDYIKIEPDRARQIQKSLRLFTRNRYDTQGYYWSSYLRFTAGVGLPAPQGAANREGYIFRVNPTTFSSRTVSALPIFSRRYRTNPFKVLSLKEVDADPINVILTELLRVNQHDVGIEETRAIERELLTVLSKYLVPGTHPLCVISGDPAGNIVRIQLPELYAIATQMNKPAASKVSAHP